MAGRGRKPLCREGAGGDGVGLGLAPCCSQNDSHLPIACGWRLTQVLISSIDTHRLGLQSIFTWNSRSIPHSLQSPISLIRLSVLERLRSWLTLCTSRYLQASVFYIFSPDTISLPKPLPGRALQWNSGLGVQQAWVSVSDQHPTL